MENNLIPTDPVALHNYILDRLSDNDTPLLDPTNPYTMLLESSILSAQQVYNNLKLHTHRYFKGIARDEEDLSYHITNMDEENLFNTPAKAMFRIYIELNNFLSNAIYIENERRYTATIPKYTQITVDNIPFTLMADVKINIVNNGGHFTSFIEHVVDDSVVDLKNIGNLNSIITKDENNVDWIIFDIPTLQLLVSEYMISITKGIDFDIRLPIEDNYNNSIATYNDNGVTKKLQNIYVESIYDINTPSIYIKINSNEVRYKIPNYYIDSDMVSGDVSILIFTTKGKLNMRLGDYSQDLFKIKMGPVNDIYQEAMTRITIISDSKYIINGGTNTISFRDLKKKLISRTNNISIPVTEKQLIEYGRKLGFSIFKYKDTILNRIYLSTTTPYGKDIVNNNIINTTFLTVSTHIKYQQDLQDSVIYNNDYIIIDKDSVFIDNNNNTELISKSKLNEIKLMDTLTAVNYFNNNSLYVSPYRYIFDLSRDIIDYRAYDIESYELDMKEILIKNKDTLENVNIISYNIFRKDNRYYLFFNLFGNDHYELIKNDIRLQLKIPTNIVNEYVYLHSELDLNKTQEFYPDATEPYHMVEIVTNKFISEENNLRIENGYANSINKLVNIFNRIEIAIYTTRLTSITDDNLNALNLNRGGIYKGDTLNAITFTIENIDLRLAKRLNYIYNSVLTIENNRIYKKYNTDIYERYDSNIYKIDPTIGCEVTIEKDANGECINVTQEVAHETGEYVLDSNGNKVLLHRKGDIILSNGEPIIDKINGIELISKLLLLDYKFQYINKNTYNKNVKETIEYLTNIITNNLDELNQVVLDNSKILYTSRYSNLPIKLNDDKYINDCEITPIINIYVESLNKDLLVINDQLINQIGNIITSYTNKKFINVDDIENEIKNKIKYASAIQVLNITEANLKTIKIDNSINRFRIKTKLTKTMDVVYDIKINIITI